MMVFTLQSSPSNPLLSRTHCLTIPYCRLPLPPLTPSVPHRHLSRTLDVTVTLTAARTRRALESSPSSNVRHLRCLRIGASSPLRRSSALSSGYKEGLFA
ncbi:hypothetical protein Ahy_B04g071085 isoform D [Arachis hypogaea]|uniref:Uncharacterized protein n=1 Tax=Arachis hypogaea TaxID=3818 RepID=A0A444ZJZ5_ARAHY|nr:hypothetical protein Ahy_B04g071085 isoform D [Arachis hypogaea]